MKNPEALKALETPPQQPNSATQSWHNSRKLGFGLAASIIIGLTSTTFSASLVSATSITLTIPSAPLSLTIDPNSTFTKSNPINGFSVKAEAPWGYELSVTGPADGALKTTGASLKSIDGDLTATQYAADGNLNTPVYVLSATILPLKVS